MNQEPLLLTVCRLCTATQTYFINLIENYDNIIDKIFECTTILITENDGLPIVVCSGCFENVKHFYDFRQNCISSQITLKEQGFQQKQQLEITGHILSLPEPEVDVKNDQWEITDEELQEVVIKELEESTCVDPPFVEEEIVKEESEEVEVTIKTKVKKRKIKEKPEKDDRRSIYQANLRPCDMCGKMVEKSRMQSHTNQHLGLQPYTCDAPDCGKTFFCPYRLTSHKRNHHSSTVYTCEICGKSYNIQKSLYNHKQKHLEPKYNCKICDRKYKNSTYLKQHMRTHTGERPYQCSQCPRAFASTYNLKAHTRSHTKEKPFVCQLCGIAYGYNCLLKAHTEKCHPIKAE